MTPLNCFDDIYFKREDLSITGSAKDRAIPFQIESLITQGFTQAVISSTGNAAISAQYFCDQKNIHLTVFVSPNTSEAKLSLLKNFQVSLKPVSDAIKYAKANNSYLLRQSTDESALIGYGDLGKEILEQVPNISSIFFPVGSGATLVGVAQVMPKNVKVFAIQSAFNCPITKSFDPSYVTETINLTDALTAKFVPLKPRVHNILKSTGGTGLVVTNQEIKSAQTKLESYGIQSSYEGGLTLAGLIKAKNNFDIGKKPVVIITGTKR
ncbi:MAG: PLP-dependent lyase/thiolase [Candidatus Shapirobacteria bacterium]|jgi:threonine dehydratase